MEQYLSMVGAGRDATFEQVKKAYRAKLMECHPDRFALNKQRQLEAQEQTKLLNFAYAALEAHFARSGGSTEVRPSEHQVHTTPSARSAARGDGGKLRALFLQEFKLRTAIRRTRQQDRLRRANRIGAALFALCSLFSIVLTTSLFFG